MKLINKILLSITTMSLLSGLVGCSNVEQSSYVQKAGLFPNRNVIYLQGQSLPSLKMPANVSPIPNDPYYVIPDIPDNSTTPVSILPPGSLAAQKAGQKG